MGPFSRSVIAATLAFSLVACASSNRTGLPPANGEGFAEESVQSCGENAEGVSDVPAKLRQNNLGTISTIAECIAALRAHPSNLSVAKSINSYFSSDTSDQSAKASRQTAQDALNASYLHVAEFLQLHAVNPSHFEEVLRWYLLAARGGSVDAAYSAGLILASGHAGEADYNEAVYWMRTAARSGDPRADLELGAAHFYGQGVRRDPASAALYFGRAAFAGNAIAQANLGRLYANGIGVEANAGEAVRWLERAAEQGNVSALLSLGSVYASDRLGTQDDKLAFSYFMSAAEAGSPTAMRQVALMYADGRGVPRSNAKAIRWMMLSGSYDQVGVRRELAAAFLHGDGVAKDQDRGIAWFEEAADLGDVGTQKFLGWLFNNDQGNIKDNKKSVYWYGRAAQQGDPEAQTNLGFMYHHGLGVAQDYHQAVEWYEKAARQGYANAQSDLGYMYQHGLGVETDYGRAYELYSAAAVQGYASAENGLGVLYFYGQGVEQSYERAHDWYIKAAAQGNSNAQTNLGVLYQNGFGVTLNHSEAVEWYQKAAQLGDAGAQSKLGYMHHEGLGVKQSYKRAVEWYRRSADQGHARGQDNLGHAYLHGLGVAKDYRRAFQLFSAAADQNDSNAMNNLGFMYALGKGVEKDQNRAYALYASAAELGSHLAQSNLGGRYEDGEGAPQSDHEALLIYRTAALKGNRAAARKLGQMYAHGRAVEKDPHEAVRWYRLAMGDDDTAKTNLAFAYYSGFGVRQNVDRAIELYEEAAENGYLRAMCILAGIFETSDRVEADPHKAFYWSKKAAEAGFAGMQANLARLYEMGIGTPRDLERAHHWYRIAAHGDDVAELTTSGVATASSGNSVQAASSNQSHPDLDALRETGIASAQAALARLAEESSAEAAPDLGGALEYYLSAAVKGERAALDRIKQILEDESHPLFAAMRAEGDVFLHVGEAEEHVDSSCRRSPIVCRSGLNQRIDLEEAATWYRHAVAAGNTTAQFRLARLLLAHPALESHAGEGIEHLQAAVANENADALFFIATMTDRQARRLELDSSEQPVFVLENLPNDVSVRLAFDGAIGRFGDRATPIAFNYLQEEADAGSKLAKLALLSVFSFFGAFDEATLLVQSSGDGLDWDLLAEFDGWADTLERTTDVWIAEARHGQAPDAEAAQKLGELLNALSSRSVDAAASLELKLNALERLLDARETKPIDDLKEAGYKQEFERELVTATPAEQVSLAELRLEEQVSLGGLSPHQAEAYRELADALMAAGKRADAMTAELSAISVNLEINNQSRHLKGDLMHLLDRACFLTKASERVLSLGYKETATLFATEAFNSLQEARRKLAGLPEGLQACFKKILSDQYRLVAEAFLEQGQFLKAYSVLDQLQDFQRYQFTRRGPEDAGRTFDAVRLSAAQRSVQDQLAQMSILQISKLKQERRVLLELDVMTPRQQSRFEELGTALQRAHEVFDSEAQRLLADIYQLEDQSHKTSLLSLDRLRQEAANGALSASLSRLGSNVAVVYTAVLPDRVHFIVTTLDGSQHIIRSIPRRDLMKRIGMLGAAARDPSSSFTELSRDLYKDVWQEVDSVLDSVSSPVDHVIVSLDLPLQQLPIAMLFDGDEFQVEKRSISYLTGSAGNALSVSSTSDDLSVAGLGVTRAISGFPALTYVRRELEAIIQTNGDTGRGILPGRAWLDGDFNRRTLERALSGQQEIVHVASHFDLRETADASSLLLGDGQFLSLSEMSRSANYQFGRVQMIVLSACETAIASRPGLNSFAGVIQGRGVETVVASLWKINDGSTAAFMERFYDHLNLGSPAAEALRLAQVEMISGEIEGEPDAPVRWGETPREERLSGYAHPYFWAPFVVMGIGA